MDSNGDCSKPKKSKSCQSIDKNNSSWDFLPTVAIEQIFDHLTVQDRINASTICRHWRRVLFHPKWWQTMRFKIKHDNIERATFLSSNFGPIVQEAIIQLDSLSKTCVFEFISLLRLLNANNRLKSLILEPSHCRFEDSFRSITKGEDTDIVEIFNFITAILPRLLSFSLGGLEDLAQYNDSLIRKLTPSKVQLLGLASVKDDIVAYEESFFKPELIASFKNLQILSIDYDQLSDGLLYDLQELKHLNRLVVHLHAVPLNHQGTTNEAWTDFRSAHPDCLLRLTVIHAYSAIKNLHLYVLKEKMPLSHIKVFFCENVNMDVLHALSMYYSNTLRSVMWIDCIGGAASNLKLMKNDQSPDPFVIMSWLCAKLEELVLYGYKYPHENLIAIARLRGRKMKNLEIPSREVAFNGCKLTLEFFKELEEDLKEAWNPISTNQLHPVILDPTAGDSDEFLLPYVLADLH